jgi:hypothetical protein
LTIWLLDSFGLAVFFMPVHSLAEITHTAARKMCR